MVDNYKNRNKPNLSEKSKWHQGYYKPEHPEKCLTKENIYRSSWELVFMSWCDRNPSILRWASEPTPVYYKNPVSNIKYCNKNNLNPNDPRNWKTAKYYTDFWIETKKEDGTLKKIFIEIKPYAQTQPPQPVSKDAPLKEQRRFVYEAETYLVNRQKWIAAKNTFNARGCEFMVITEKSLAKLGLLVD